MLEQLVPELSLPENVQLSRQLEAMLADGRLPHALVIEGGDPAANDRLARLCARAFLCTCERPLAGQCRACRLITAYGAHADIVLVEGTGKTGAISVDVVRSLQERAAQIPADADGQVYLLEECDSMLAPAQNAFLKLFEEPPPGVMFIMTCRSALNLLETIRSRACVLHAFWPEAQPDETEIQMRAFAEQFATALASERDGDSLMLTGSFSRPAAKNPAVRQELAALFAALRAIFRDALVIGAGATAPKDGTESSAVVLARTFSPERIAAMLDELPTLEQALRTNSPIPLLITAMCVRLRRAAGR